MERTHPGAFTELLAAEKADGVSSLGRQQTLELATFSVKRKATLAPDAAAGLFVIKDHVGFSFPLSLGLSIFIDQVVRFVLATGKPFSMPSAETITARVSNLFQSTLVKLSKLLANCVGLAYTTDGWTCKYSKHSFLCVTGHWIDQAWTLHRACLGVARVQGEDRKSAGIAPLISNILKRVTNSAWHGTTDNGGNYVNAVRDELNHQHTRCFAHTIQLVVKEAIEQFDGVLDKCKAVVRAFHMSSDAALALESMQSATKEKRTKLISWTPTRWDSVFLMIRSVCWSEKALTNLQVQFVEHGSQLNAEDFVKLNELMIALRPFYEADRTLEGDSYITSALLIPTWKTLEFNALEIVGKRNELRARRGLQGRVSGDIAKSLFAKLKAREQKDDWGFSNASKIATFLDPRFRSLAFFEEDERDDVTSLVRVEMAKQRFALNRGEDKKDSGEVKAEAQEKDGKAESTDKSRGKRALGEIDGAVRAPKRQKSLLGTVVARFADKQQEQPTRSEIQRYLDLVDPSLVDDKFNVLKWWAANEKRFPILAHLARRYLPIQATNAAAERVWSDAGNTIDETRSRTSDANFEALIVCRQNWALMLETVTELFPEFDIADLAWLQLPGKAAAKAAAAKVVGSAVTPKPTKTKPKQSASGSASGSGSHAVDVLGEEHSGKNEKIQM